MDVGLGWQLAARATERKLAGTSERIEEIDRMLFDAGVLTLGATTKQLRKEADSKIMDARVKLEQLRKQLS